MPERAVGVRLIVTYKLVKAGLEAALALLALVVLSEGMAQRIHVFAVELREQVVSAWSVRFADLLLRETTPRRLTLGTLALAFDGALTAVEGWSLHRRYRWAPWLIVGATAALLPFEIAEMIERMRVARVLVFALNVAIVAYLARRAYSEHRHVMGG